MIGWREWVSLPELGIHRIKAKIDTGARTSALHAFRVVLQEQGDRTQVIFDLHPLQSPHLEILTCVADLVDIRTVTDSGGHREERYVIRTSLAMGGACWPIEVTLTNRDDMNFRMLIGRTAMQDRFLIQPSASYLLGEL